MYSSYARDGMYSSHGSLHRRSASTGSLPLVGAGDAADRIMDRIDTGLDSLKQSLLVSTVLISTVYQNN